MLSFRVSAALVCLLSLCAAACSGPLSSHEQPGNDAGSGTRTDAAPSADGSDDGALLVTDEAGGAFVESTLARDPASDAAVQAAVTANNAFALKLYAEVAPTVDGGNLITSPLSASLALTMTYAGARGQTATEMASALQFAIDAGSPFDGQNALSQALNGRAAAAFAFDQNSFPSAKPSPTDYQLQVVNSVWGQKSYPWASSFLDVLAKSYGTGMYLQDFASAPEAARQAINGWVSSETAGKIQDLFAPSTIKADTRMVLVNAIHLKLPWAAAFWKGPPAKGPFTRGDGTVVTASFLSTMNAQSSAGDPQYADTPTAQVVSIPLAGNELSAIFLLPKTNLTDFLASLTPTGWAALANTQVVPFEVTLPTFTFTSPSMSLTPALKALGMMTAFDPTAANFEGLCSATPDGGRLYIADVPQKATLSVSENGVEAAAATGLAVSTYALPMIRVTFDHPFLVAVVDSSGAIVFLGQIDDPTAGG